MEERPITIEEVLDVHADGSLEEVFGAGTAAVISPVGSLDHKGRTLHVANGGTGPFAERLFDELMGIQYGTRPDSFGWIHEVAPTGMGGASAASG